MKTLKRDGNDEMSHSIEERKERLRKYHLIPLSEKMFIRNFNWVYDWKIEEWVKRQDYSKNYTLNRRDNMNPRTEGVNFGSGCSGSWMRIPSKKHKNRYKNFLKLFPKMKYEQV